MATLKGRIQNFYWVKVNPPGSSSDFKIYYIFNFLFVICIFHANECLFHKQTVAIINTSRFFAQEVLQFYVFCFIPCNADPYTVRYFLLHASCYSFFCSYSMLHTSTILQSSWLKVTNFFHVTVTHSYAFYYFYFGMFNY